MQCKYKAGDMSHILYDLFFIGPAGSDSCKLILPIFCSLQITKIKSDTQENGNPPTSKVTIYGIVIDSDKTEARLPHDKAVNVRKS